MSFGTRVHISIEHISKSGITRSYDMYLSFKRYGQTVFLFEPVNTLASSIQEFSCIFLKLLVTDLFYFSHYDQCIIRSYCGLIHISLVTNEAEHISILCLLAILIAFFVICLFNLLV
jgi:hypothetical protein